MVLLIFIWGRGGGLRAENSGHPYSDAVLVPRFTADFNDWWHQHPKEPDHFRKIDVKDRKRWEAARDAFETLKREMTNAGY